MRLRHKFPKSAGENPSDYWNGHAELPGKPRQVPATFRNCESNSPDIRFLQFCSAVCLSFTGLASAFTHSVLVVFFQSSKKQMFRIAANLVVAFMANAQAFWNGAVCKLKRYSVSAVDFMPPSEFSVSIPSTSHPRPALTFSVFRYFSPEPIRVVVVFASDIRKHFIDFGASSIRFHIAHFMRILESRKGGICPNV